MEYVTLSNGVKMPKNGYGVYQISKNKVIRYRKKFTFSHYDHNMVTWFDEIVTSRRLNHNHEKDKKNW